MLYRNLFVWYRISFFLYFWFFSRTSNLFELGLTGIITQFVAHEASHLHLDESREYVGKSLYKSRLWVKFCAKWYIICLSTSIKLFQSSFSAIFSGLGFVKEQIKCE